MSLLTYDRCPILFSQRPDLWVNLLFQATMRTVRLGLIGDSTWDPDGNGAGYTERLSLELNRLFAKGNTPATKLTAQYADRQELTPAGWLLGGYRDTGATSLASTKIPYGINPRELPSTTNGLTAALLITGASADNSQATPYDPTLVGAGPFNGGEYMQLPPDPSTDPVIEVEILAYTLATSGEIAYAGGANATGHINTGDNAVSGTSALTLQSGTYAVKSQKFQVPLASGKRYIEASAISSTTAKVGLLGLRFQNLYNPAGFVVQPLSLGGKKTADWTADCSDASLILLGLGLDCVALGFGINDRALATKTAAQYKTDVLAAVAQVRTFLGATFPVLLGAPRYYAGSDAEYDLYAGALYEIARADSYTMFWNRRLVLSNAGINATSYATYLVDGTHDNLAGARLCGLTDARTLASIARLPVAGFRSGLHPWLGF